MCGIAGIFSSRRDQRIDRGVLDAMRDRMDRRGPDGAGSWTGAGAGMGHRRLAVVDPSPTGAQPMLWVQGAGGRGGAVTADRYAHAGMREPVRFALVYNGELYNDAELREELAGLGVEFHSRSDTETVLAALAVWGMTGVDRLRGMYALGFVDVRSHRLLLARDPLGIKPLYFTSVKDEGTGQLLFGSQIPALLEHPGVQARPDAVTVSAYLTTIRTTLGERTLYEGISTLEPGQRMVVEGAGNELRLTRSSWWDGRGAGTGVEVDVGDAGVAARVEDSVRRHLRSDVPVCCLLSGGLDSSIIARVSRDLTGSRLTTFCAGADGASGGSDDFAFARMMAEELGSTHVEAPVTQEMFIARWQEMVERLGIPISTPNEIAINEVARKLRAGGFTVALSGEGADELFGGYEGIMAQCQQHVSAARGDAWRGSGGRFHLDLAAWVPVEAKDAVLGAEMVAAAGGDVHLRAEYERMFAGSAAGLGPEGGMQAHLRFQRRVNLAGLLLRLDQATMLESVEGRTPLADQEIAALAEGLPMGRKFVAGASAAGPHESKIALRGAFGARLPEAIAARPKASFPLPFQQWLGDAQDLVRNSPAAKEWFTEAGTAVMCSQAAQAWKFAWPMMNVAMWSRRFG